MPVDLDQERDDTMEDMPPLTSEDELPTHRSNFSHAQQLLAHIMGEDHDSYDRSDLRNELPVALKSLNPYSATLGLSDLESCVKLEALTFDPELAGSREKFAYRLSKSSELCFGIFTSADSSSQHWKAETAALANPADSNTPTRKSVLLAQIIATKSATEFVQDVDMSIGGHDEAGRTVALHSISVLPGYQKRGLASILMKAYVQRINDSRIADRISLLAFEHLVPFYESLGFEDRGKSESKYGGKTWVNMTLEFADLNDEDEDDEDE